MVTIVNYSRTMRYKEYRLVVSRQNIVEQLTLSVRIKRTRGLIKEHH